MVKGVWALTNTLAVELIDIEYGIEDVAIIREPSGRIRKATIQYGVGDAYIQPYGDDGMTLYFSECMRI